MLRRFGPLFAAIVLFLAIPSQAGAQTSLPNNITSDQTWTSAGSPYTGGNVTIDPGVTVTVEPGAVVKLWGTLTVNGTLDVNGTAQSPAVFTSTSDSAAGQWTGIKLKTGTSSLDYAEVRYAQTGIDIGTSVSPTVTNSTSRNNSSNGIKIYGGSPEIAQNTVSDNGNTGITYSMPSDTSGELHIHDNLIERNAGGGVGVSAPSSTTQLDGITLGGNTINDNTGWRAISYEGYANTSFSGGYQSVSLPPDIDENSLSGNAQNGVWVSGELQESTTWEDRGYPLVLHSSGVIVASGATLTLSPGLTMKSDMRSMYVVGALDAQGTLAEPITFTSIKDDSVAGDTNGDGGATQPAPGNWQRLQFRPSATGALDHVTVHYGGVYNYPQPAAAVAIQCPCSTPASISNSTVRYSATSGIDVSGGGSPPITNSTVRNNSSNGIRIYGGSPEIAGNTVSDNGNVGITYSMPQSTSGELRIHDNLVERNAYTGIGVSAPSAYTQLDGMTLGGNTVNDNGGKAIYYEGYVNSSFDPRYESVPVPPDIDENSVSGNAQNGVWVSGEIAQSTAWEDRGYPLVLHWGGVMVPTGATLTLSPSLTIKSNLRSLIVAGALDAQGTVADPITFTSIKDDSVAGDTNGDGGATQPAPGDWTELEFKGSGTGAVNHADIRYGGFYMSGYANDGGTVAVECPCPNPPTIRNSTITRSANSGGAVNGNSVGGSAPIFADSTIANNQSGLTKSGTDFISALNIDWGCLSGPSPHGCGNGIIGNILWTAAASAISCGGFDTECPINADPVVLSTGGLVYAHTDLSLTNKGDSPLELRRTYNSHDSEDSGFGPGWSHGGLLVASEQASGDVLIRRADGRGDLFTEGAASYDPPPGVHDELVKEGDGTFKLTAPDETVYDFNSTGRIASITDDHGLTTTYGYNGSGRLATITDPSGQILTFSYNSSNHVIKVADSTGREVSYTYTAAGDLDTVTDPLGGVTDYDYDSERRLQSITDPRDVTFLTNTYDSQDRVIEQLDGENNLWTLDYLSGETEVTEPEGGTKTFAFDSSKRLTAETDQLGNTSSYTYDTAGNVDTITRPGGAEWDFDYDSAGNLTSATDPLGGTRAITYDGDNHPTSFTDPRLETWVYTWTGDDLTKVTDPAAGETELTYDASGQPLTITDPNDHTTELAYDAGGNLTSRTDALDHATSYGYNTRNQLTAVTEPGKPAETYTRNALGDLLSVTTPEGNTTSYDYDANGAPIEITDPALKVWTIERDGMERPTAYVDPLNNRTEIAYDGNLNPVSVTDRRDETTAYTYDLANRLTGIDLPEGGSWDFAYDGRGNRTSVTDPRSNQTSSSYDLNDRMTQADEPLSTTTTYGYDAAGNLTSVTDPRSNQTSFTYDELGRMTGISQPLEKDTAFTYDPAGNLTSRITDADALVYSYDDADRLTEITDGTSTLRSFAYDAADRMTEATDAQTKTLAIGYDDDDRVTSLDDDRGQTAALTYDSRGNLTQQVDGRGTVQYAYDELSRMTQLTDPQSEVSDFAYDPEGNLTQADLPNGVATTNSYDGDGRLTNTSSEKAGAALQSFAYAYDAAGNRTSQTDRLGLTTTYAYDALNRLTEFDPPVVPATTYAYDAAGNRTQAGTTTYAYNALNQLTDASELGVPTTTYAYDPAGRLASKTRLGQTSTYSWDALDQLTGVDDGLNPITYSYDALGRRAERTEGSDTRTAHYGDLSDRPILETDQTPQVTRSYVQGPEGMLLGERSGGATSYPLPDGHGDLTTVTDDTGAVSSRQEYDPWGAQLSGPARENGYLGAYQRPTDSDTGLLQMGVRPYDPALGQFPEEDPVLGIQGLGQSLNRYPYAWDNPLNMYDLDGRSPWWDATGGRVWDWTAGARDSVGLAGENSAVDAAGDAVADARGWIGDLPEDFLKVLRDIGDCLWEPVGIDFNPNWTCQHQLNDEFQDILDWLEENPPSNPPDADPPDPPQPPVPPIPGRDPRPTIR